MHSSLGYSFCQASVIRTANVTVFVLLCCFFLKFFKWVQCSLLWCCLQITLQRSMVLLTNGNTNGTCKRASRHTWQYVIGWKVKHNTPAVLGYLIGSVRVVENTPKSLQFLNLTFETNDYRIKVNLSVYLFARMYVKRMCWQWWIHNLRGAKNCMKEIGLGCPYSLLGSATV